GDKNIDDKSVSFLDTKAIIYYCALWTLKLNVTKTKPVVFSRGKLRNKPSFYHRVVLRLLITLIHVFNTMVFPILLNASEV
ncbi:hypothetical protein MAR_027949, partial [Mya arenaria]